MRTLVLVHDNGGDATIDKPKLHDPEYIGDLWIELKWTPPGAKSEINVYDGDPQGSGNLIGALGPQSIFQAALIHLATGPVSEVYFDPGNASTTHRIYSHN